MGEGDKGAELKMETSDWWRSKLCCRCGIMAHQVLKPPWIIIVLQQDSCYGARLLLHSLAVGQLSTAALLRVLVLPHLGRTGMCPVCGQLLVLVAPLPPAPGLCPQPVPDFRSALNGVCWLTEHVAFSPKKTTSTDEVFGIMHYPVGHRERHTSQVSSASGIVIKLITPQPSVRLTSCCYACVDYAAL